MPPPIAVRDLADRVKWMRSFRGDAQAHIWQLPARYVGAYAEADAANTLALWEDLDPVLDREKTPQTPRS
jgi:hypothetical protein